MLQDAVLAEVEQSPGTVREIWRRMEAKFGTWWGISDQVVRGHLKSLTTLGFVETKVQTRKGKPVFAITDAGREALQEWRTSDEFSPSPFRDDLHLRLFYFDPAVDTSGLRAALEASLRNLVAKAMQLGQPTDGTQSPGDLSEELREYVVAAQIKHLQVETDLVTAVSDTLAAHHDSQTQRGAKARRRA